ncbi:unnamed protein product [Calypogeia fissa]
MRMVLTKNMGNFAGMVLVFIFCTLGALVTGTSARNCSAKSLLVGLSSDFVMVQHQLRGSVLFLDDCTFKVTRFDMIAGNDVYWWGSLGDDFDNMTQGFSISPNKLNETYQNVTMEVTLDSNYTWDDFKVLSVWDRFTGSDFGHVYLEVLASEVVETGPPRQSGSDFGNAAPAPGPEASFVSAPASAPAPSTPELEIIGHSQPTMFDNCVSLKDGVFRLRWTVNWDSQTVDLGLEGALTTSQYMAFGWAQPGVTSSIMLRSDVVVAGFDEKDGPYAEDYYVGAYKECNWDTSAPSGVCPDSVYTGGTDNSANSNALIHGQRIDGITLIRYQRPLASVDHLYDVAINASDVMQVIYAIGKMKPPELTKGNLTPQDHGPNHGSRMISLADTIDECLGPMVAQNGYLGDIVVADRGTTLVVTTDAPSHYPDPPYPDKVFYINQKEAPLLKVERGVPVTFSVQAGHGFAFYITDNPVGGASNSNASETVYAGGPEAHGVPVIPYELTWHPNRTTPDLVYYQDYFMEKRGWRVQVVDGGLSDMYNQSALLADNKVTLFWTVSSGRVYLAVRGEVKSGYLAIAFGSGMVNSFSYVGWVDEMGSHINAYWMDGKKASSIHPTGEVLEDWKCENVDGIMTFEFSRALQPSCNKGTLCKNVIDPESTLKVVWAMGDAWSDGELADSNMHTDISTRPTLIQLDTGASQVEELQPVLAVHGFMMFIAWGLLLPGGVLGARYLKHLNNNGWFEIHIYAQLSAIVVMLLGLLFAIAELHGFNFRTAHMKVGLLSISIALLQALNGYLRPKNASHGESQRPQRVIWQYIHMYSGRSALVLGFLALVTGISQLARRDGVEHMKGLQWALFAWFLAVAAVVGYIEVQGFWSKKGHGAMAFDRILGTEDGDGTEDLLAESHAPFFPESKEMQASTARGQEIQLEALH